MVAASDIFGSVSQNLRPSSFLPYSSIQATGAGNFVVPAGVFWIRATVLSGGAAGRRAVNLGGYNTGGPGGAAGGRSRKIIKVTPGQVIPYTVGLGGQTEGAAGGDTTFGTGFGATGAVLTPVVTGTGATLISVAGAGGTGYGGDPGQDLSGGGGGPAVASNQPAQYARGGFGGGAPPANMSASGGNAFPAYNPGGQGAPVNFVSSGLVVPVGGGAPGYYWYDPNTAASGVVLALAGTSGGGGGGGGGNGGADFGKGSSGEIIVEVPMAGSSAVKSVQRGTASTSTVTISAVDITKSLLIITGQYSGGYDTSGYLQNSTTITIPYGANGAYWQVVEYY